MTRSALPRRLVWLIRCAIAALLFGVVLLGIDTRHRIAQRRHEHSGVVTVADCTFETFGQHGNTYWCLGTFRSSAGDLLVPAVTFDNVGRLARGDTVNASVSGPDDRSADTDGVARIGWQLGLIVGALAGIGALLRRLLSRRPRALNPGIQD